MIALVDCNNFFASCERLFRPDLKNKPVLVLSNNDGCVVARSNEVKQLDIPMGVPYFKVKDIVEYNGVTYFSSNFPLYSNISQRILGLLTQRVPELEVYSIDEAFLNLKSLPITNYASWAKQLKKDIEMQIGMPVSVGIAPTKTLAKLASDWAKPNGGVCWLDPTQVNEYKAILQAMPVGEVWGIGRQLQQRFAGAGIRTAWHLAQASQQWLHSQISITGSRMYQELHGLVAYPFDEVKAPQKTLMASRSFGHTVRSFHQLESAAANFASQAAYRLRKHNQMAGVFGLYLGYRDSEGSMRGQSAAAQFLTSTNDTSQFVVAAIETLKKLYDPMHGYKKAGVFAHHLSSANICQLSLLDPDSQAEKARRKQFLEAIDSINRRYGSETIHVGTIDPQAKQWQGRKERISPAYTTDWSQLPLVHRA